MRHPHESDPSVETSFMFSSSEIKKEMNSCLQNINYLSVLVSLHVIILL
jgi:hypothetical protein